MKIVRRTPRDGNPENGDPMQQQELCRTSRMLNTLVSRRSVIADNDLTTLTAPSLIQRARDTTEVTSSKMVIVELMAMAIDDGAPKVTLKGIEKQALTLQHRWLAAE